MGTTTLGEPYVATDPIIVSPDGFESEAWASNFHTITVVPPPDQTVYPTAVASTESFGTANVAYQNTVGPSGIDSAESFGTLATTINVDANGIASTSSVGTHVVTHTLGPDGVTSQESFGSLTMQVDQDVAPTGVGSTESFGTASIGLTVAPTGTDSTETVPSPSVGFGITPSGIDSGDSFGTPTVLADQAVFPTATESSESVPSPSVLIDQVVEPTGIDSAESFGTATAALGAQFIEPTGIDSAESFGTADVSVVVRPGAWTVSLTTSVTFADPGIDMGSVADTAGVVLGGRGTYSVVSDTPGADLIGGPASLAEIAAMDIRALPSLSVTMPTPALVRGLPYTPDALLDESILMSADGTVYPDPDDPGAVIAAPEDEISGPGGPLTMYRWKAADATGAASDWVEEWPEVGGGPSWYSVYPYRPEVLSRREFLRDNKRRTYSKTLNFNYKFTEHMWTDLGDGFVTPTSGMTVMMAVILRGYWGGKWKHNIFDSGKQPPAGIDPGAKKHFDDGFKERVGLAADRKRLYVASAGNLKKGQHIRVPNKRARKPRVLFAVYNGSESFAGWKMSKRHKVRYASLAQKDFRNMVMGRRRNAVGHKYASNMVVFEVRIWNGPLTWQQIKKKAERMETKYKFNKFQN